jgi:hypothetical protein
MRTTLLCILPFAILGCPAAEDTGAKDNNGTDDTGADDTGNDDTGNDDTGETGDSGDTADTGEVADPLLTGVSWDFVDQAITTRNPLGVIVTASYDDGSNADVSADATYSSSDPAVANVYVAGQVQPIDAGTTTIGASYGGVDLSGSLTVTVVAATNADLVFNEVLADGTVDGDPNGDGTLNSVEDEFVEIANVSGVTVDISGCTIVEDDFYTGLPRHTFVEGTLLHAGEAVVVFGGGDASSLSASFVSFVVAENADSGLQYGLSLNNDGERVELRDPSGGLLTSFTYGTGGDIDAIEDASMVRTPDVEGTTWTHHAYAAGSISDYSPGSYVDGSAFPGPDGYYSR